MNLRRSHTNKTYIYRPLENENSIRILALAAGNYGDPLNGFLKNYDLRTDTPNFHALSYVWGEPLFTQTLHCDGKELVITKNLEVALRRIRHPQNDVSIWADQVCIDQTNLHERAIQVGLMGLIYATAGPVVTWLGLDPIDYAASAFGALKRFTRSPDLYDIRNVEVAALAELARCPYFTRLWVMQEITNSSHKAAINKVLWGLDHEITVQDLTVGLFHVVRLTTMSPFQWKAFRWLPEVIGHDNIFDVLAWVRSRQCADDRDRIYGIIRITMRGDDFWNRWMKEIVPDYSVSVNQVYRKVASHMVSSGAIAFMLNSVHHRELPPWRDVSWPSWIPRWNEDVAVDYKMYKHLPEEEIAAHVDRDQGRLHLHCLRIGTILKCSTGQLLTEADSSTSGSAVFDAHINFSEIYSFWDEHNEQHDKSSSTESFWRQVHFACVFCAPAKDELGELDKCGELLQNANLEWKQSRSEACAKAGNVRRMLDVLQDSLAELRTMYNVRQTKEDTPNLSGKDTFRGRKVFSANNNLIGLGPQTMRKGDIIVHIPGSQTPFVFRKQESFYQCVGAASIPTTLRLAAIEQASRQGETPQKVELR